MENSGTGKRWRILAAFPLALILLVSTAELALADRKYGLFSGGFGMSRAISEGAEIWHFALGYALAMGVLGLAGWMLSVRLTRSRPAWQACFVFLLTNGALFCALLAAQYQLHSYFSDAVGFALLKQLGGGSLVDALLYGLSEIGIALLGVAAAGLGAWLFWRLARRLLGDSGPSARAPRGRWLLGLLAVFVIASFALFRADSDARFGLNRTLAWQALTGPLDLASDVDRDGYGLFSVQSDTAPFDSARHPLALDIPGNGIDEDGYGGDLELVALPEALGPQALGDTKPHLVIVVLESTRYDVIGKRIGGKQVAPNLEALVAGGDVASPAFSHVGFTTESLKSIFSGRLVPRAGDPSLFTDLKRAGYRIGVYSGQSEDFGDIAATVGMKASADQFVDAEILREKRAFDFAAQGSLLVDESHLLEAFDSGLGAQEWTAPHFLYFNFQSPHFPYHHEGVPMRVIDAPLSRGEIGADRAEEVQATYWNAVANADAWLGEVIARLKARGVWDDTLLIVTGDHGEELFETGFLGHGHVIGSLQNGTLLASNRPGSLPAAPVGLSDYRAIVMAALTGGEMPAIAHPPFMHIGPLDTPTAIGMAWRDGEVISLRLDTGAACFSLQPRCIAYDNLDGPDRAMVDSLVARWGSERWREHNR